MKIFNIVETSEDEPVNWENKKSGGTEEEYYRAVKQEASARHHSEVFMSMALKYSDLVVKAYNPDEFKVPVTHKIEFNYIWWGIPEGTPNAERLWAAIKLHVERYEHANKMMGRYQRLAAKLKKKYRAETLSDLKLKNVPVRIDSVNVPRKIYYTSTSYFENPYWEPDNVIRRYAGPAGHFPNFKPAELNTLVELEKSLRKFGLPGMTKMFACTIKKNNGPYGVVNKNRFVAFGADGRLIWKYTTGGNVIYIDGKKVSITNLINVTVGSRAEMDQRNVLEPLRNPK